MKTKSILILLLTAALLLPTAKANQEVFYSNLSGSNEIPANASSGTGSAKLTLDLDLFTMRVEANFSALLGTVTGANIHAPTGPHFAGNVGVATQLPSFDMFPSGVTSGTYDHTFDLTLASTYNPAFITANGGTVSGASMALIFALEQEMSYFNIRTSIFPGGEIRGFPLRAIGNGGSAVLSPGSSGVLVPGATVMVALGARDVGPSGHCTTASLTGTLQTSGGVTNLIPVAQNYGVICAGAPVVFRNFTFTISPSLRCGETVTASLVMTDGITTYGTLTYTFITSASAGITFSQNFDAVAPPALPLGWVATNAQGPLPLWVTSASVSDSAPNNVFIDDPAVVSDKRLDTPSVSISSALAQVSFRNNFNLETSQDGAVLEVSSPTINGGAFTDVTDAAAGGSFVSGEYGFTLNASTNPIAGRMAWSGNSAGYIDTVVNLGPNVAGQTIKLRFRLGSNSTVAGTGWRIDSITLTDMACASNLLVTTVADHDDGVCNAADCTLREAIIAANGRNGGIIGFASGVIGSIPLTAALPILTKNIVVQGPGANLLTVRRNTGTAFRIFTISPGVVASFSGLTITNGDASGHVPSIGGGIYNDHATVTVSNCMVTGNTGFPGGGIFNRGSTSSSASLSMSNSTLSANVAAGGQSEGGAIYNEGLAGGTVTVNLTNCTVSGNVATNAASAAMLNWGQNGAARTTLTNCTYNLNAIDNRFGTLLLGNTLLAASPGANLTNTSGTVTSLGHNLSSDAASGFLIGPGDMSNTNPQLAGLANNGGPTDTIALLANSPAINAGDNNFAPQADQRSYSRAGVSDIGAFEFGGIAPPPTATPTPTSTATPVPTPTPTATPCPGLGNMFLQNFDGVTAPALPAGWVAANAIGAAPLWVTSAAGTPAPAFDSAPNAAFISGPETISDKQLNSPSIAIGGPSAQLTFKSNYNLEFGGGGNFYDGGVLEISIGGGAFTDILTAGGGFVTGGYNGAISTSFGNPIAGRSAWSGSSAGFITTTVNLPAAAAGQNIVLRWRMGSDSDTVSPGWRIDGISIVDCLPPTPTPTPPVPLAVISQVFGGGGNTGAPLQNDFIEIFNRGSTNVDLSGWSVQYASAAGTSWAVTPLCPTGPCTLVPGRYYLVQEASGGAVGSALPMPNVIGTINLSGTTGKVALVTNTTPLSGNGCTFNAALVDFVGYGLTANCFEGAGFAPAPSNTTADFRAGGGCIDTDNNASNFSIGTPAPRNTSTPLNLCPTPTPTPTPALVGISGTTVYCSNPSLNPVSGVSMTRTGTSGGVTSTDSSGDYTFTGLASGGSYTVTPTKAALTPGTNGIDGADVVAVIRHFLEFPPLIPAGCQQEAADADTQAVGISGADIVAIQRFYLGLPNSPTSRAGQYRFTPASRSYPGVVSNQTGQNYDVLIYGDVADSFVHRPEGGPSQAAGSEMQPGGANPHSSQR